MYNLDDHTSIMYHEPCQLNSTARQLCYFYFGTDDNHLLVSTYGKTSEFANGIVQVLEIETGSRI
jgi:hypothetical protein